MDDRRRTEIRQEKPIEEEEFPRRWIVKSGNRVTEVRQESKNAAIALFSTGAQARLMGTHETLKHAAKRVGWAA